MPITGNTSYKDIKDKQYLSLETDNQQKIIDELNKQNIPFSASYDEQKITITFSKSDFEKVNEVVKSSRIQQPAHSSPEAPVDAEAMIKEARKQAILDILRIQEDPDFRNKFLEENKIDFEPKKVSEPSEQQAEQEHSKENNSKDKDVPENTFDIQKLDTTKDSYKLLPIINSKVENQQQRVDTLSVKRNVAEEKISMHRERINHLNEKAARLETTNQMLKELANSKMTPAFIKSAAEKAVRVNEDKIAKIRNEKIPNREAKIEKQQNKIEKLDKKINLARCKINRYKSFNNVITSFSIINNSERRQQFAAAMDNLHKSSVNLYNARIDISTARVSSLTEKYKNTNDLAVKSVLQKSLTRQKSNRQKCIDKRNKLIGVVIPMTAQPKDVQNEALKRAEKAVNKTLENANENINVAEVSDKVAVAPLPTLPEHSVVEPEPAQDFKLLLPEIATVMDVSVSELNSKPKDIQELLVLDYTNNFDSSLEEIQESLSSIITPNARVEEHLYEKKEEQAVGSNQQGKEKDNPLKTAEELTEGNANMIDGIINNEPPKKDEPKREPPKNEKPQGFSFSLSQIKQNAKRISQQKSAPPQDKQRKPPDHGAI